jgi:5-methylcytosine-specific restriction endonuclease McrA
MTPSTEIYRYLIEMERRHGAAEVRIAIKKYRSAKTRAIVAGKEPTKRKRIPKGWVRLAYDRQNGFCPRCAEALDLSEKHPAYRVTGDHLEPVTAGGAHTAENIVAMHGRCNSAKGRRSLYEDIKRTGQSLVERNRLTGTTTNE